MERKLTRNEELFIKKWAEAFAARLSLISKKKR